MVSFNILLTITELPPCTHHNSHKYLEMYLPIYKYTHILTSKGIAINAQVRTLNYPHLSGLPQSYVHNRNVETVPHFSFFAHLVCPLALYIFETLFK